MFFNNLQAMHQLFNIHAIMIGTNLHTQYVVSSRIIYKHLTPYLQMLVSEAKTALKVMESLLFFSLEQTVKHRSFSTISKYEV